MPTQASTGKLQFEVEFRPAKMRERKGDSPFNLLVLGDFSGRFNRGQFEPIAQRKVWRIDSDNFAEMPANLDARLRLSTAHPIADPPELRFGQLADFHPDQLLKRIATLSTLLAHRQRLLDPATAQAASTEVPELLPQTSISSADPPKPSPAASASDVDTMARLLGGTARPTPAPATSPTPTKIEQLLRQAVGSSVVPEPTPRQTSMLSAVELELAAQLRARLHHPDFQALEANWRGLDLLVRIFGGEENIKLWLVDVSKEELNADLRTSESLDGSGIAKLLRRQAEDQPWTLCLGLYSFGAELAEIELLGRLTGVAAQSQTPFIAAAAPQLVNCASFGAQPDPDDWNQPMPAESRAAWTALRALPQAAYLGLAMPRFLLRQPYGQQSDPIEAFGFNELSSPPEHEGFLWGNPALLCGYLSAACFLANGWSGQCDGGEVGELPVYLFDDAGEKAAKPCAEIWLGERAVRAILDRGLVPVLSIKGRDAVRVPALPTLAGSQLSLG